MSAVADSAHVRIILADYAIVDAAGKLNIVGGGITIIGVNVSTGLTAPHAVAVLVTFDPVFLGESPAVEMSLESEHGELVSLPSAGGVGTPQAIRVGLSDHLKAPTLPGALVPPDATRPSVHTVLNFNNGLPLAPGQKYRWRVKVDHTTRDEWTETFFIPTLAPGPVVG